MLVTLDIPKANEEKFKKLLEEYGVEVQHYQEIGPAGGNPCWHLLADTRDQMQALVDFYFD